MSTYQKYQKKSRNGLSGVIDFYVKQLEYLRKVGIGNETNHKTIVSDRLINATKRRLDELRERKISTRIRRFYARS